ncbi:nicotinate N-methyltransferase 1 [Curcuma longa]|uniref:nicotinate N-methyltransferase 1 n=1 Tax=Curcuma longa TaxID=136217 RepID=UPI003D9EB9E8
MATSTGAGDYASSEMAKEARLAMMDLANMISVPMALNAVVRLNVPDAVWQSGLNTPLSAAEILALLRPPPPPSSDPDILQRLLRLLASYGVFAETRCAASGARRYALTAVGRTLVPSSSGAESYAAYVLQHHQDALVRAWPLIHEAVLDPTGPEPFARANNGVPAYAYYGGDPEANALMQRAMQGVSEPFMETLLDGYGAAGFGGDVQTLVDVGGSSGSCLYMIMQRFPNIKQGINFDLPEVVNAAPPLPGVKHVGGNMFQSVPAGDVIFMKWVLTTWTDEECTSILRNCYEALPEGGGGKVIACEPVLPEETDDSRRTRALLEGDIFVMTIYRTQGRERTEEEFRRLGVAAGFSSCSAMYLDPFYTILEYTK